MTVGGLEHEGSHSDLCENHQKNNPTKLIDVDSIRVVEPREPWSINGGLDGGFQPEKMPKCYPTITYFIIFLALAKESFSFQNSNHHTAPLRCVAPILPNAAIGSF